GCLLPRNRPDRARSVALDAAAPRRRRRDLGRGHGPAGADRLSVPVAPAQLGGRNGGAGREGRRDLGPADWHRDARRGGCAQAVARLGGAAGRPRRADLPRHPGGTRGAAKPRGRQVVHRTIPRAVPSRISPAVSDGAGMRGGGGSNTARRPVMMPVGGNELWVSSEKILKVCVSPGRARVRNRASSSSSVSAGVRKSGGSPGGSTPRT